jgi:hypothetical protein
MIGPDDPRHGTNAGYQAHHKWGVPMCQPCRSAHAAQHQQFRNRRYLERRETLLIDPTPTIRRVRALQAIGWTLRHIDHEIGGSGSNGVWNMLHQPSIHVDTAARIAQVYDKLHMTPGPSTRTRNLAMKRGWVPPLGWDDIDTDEVHADLKIAEGVPFKIDLDEVLVQRILGGDLSVAPDATSTEREEVVRRWTAATGRSLADLERNTNWNVNRYAKRVAARKQAA